MDAVAAADGDRVLVLEGAFLQGGQQQVEVGQQQVGGPHQLHVQAGVQHVRRGHALVHEARFRADDFGQVGQEGDDVMLHFGLDGVDARHVELASRLSQTVFAAPPAGITPSSACASQACASISNQMRNFRARRPDGGHFGAGIAGDHVELQLQRIGHILSDRCEADQAVRISQVQLGQGRGGLLAHLHLCRKRGGVLFFTER
jgi:hypothetical protein